MFLMLRSYALVAGTILNRIFGGLWAEFLRVDGDILVGGAIYGPDIVTVPYSNSMTPDLGLGSHQQINPTNNTAFTINAPLYDGAAMDAANPGPTGFQWTLTIRNASGGALGAATLNAALRLAAWTQPANGFSRSITFQWNGTTHVEVSRTTVDVPN